MICLAGAEIMSCDGLEIFIAADRSMIQNSAENHQKNDSLWSQESPHCITGCHYSPPLYGPDTEYTYQLQTMLHYNSINTRQV